MVSIKRCVVLLAPTEKATRIMEDEKGRLSCSFSPKLPKKGRTNYFMYIIYGAHIVASNDPTDKYSKIPVEFLKFYCRVNGIDSIMVKFYPEPEIKRFKGGGIEWAATVFKPITNRKDEIIFELPRRFKLNYIARR